MYEFLNSVANPIGIVGVVLILIAYFLLSTDKMKANTYSYQILNCVGAWLILYSLFFHWNLASVVIEVAWIVISFLGIYRAYKASAANL